MSQPKESLLTKIANKLFAKQYAAAQKRLWELCQYGVEDKHPAFEPLHIRIREQVIKGAKINVQNDQGDTPLMLLCRRGMTLEAKCLLALGADAGIANNKGETPFLTAAAAGDGGMVKEFLEKGADPFAKDPSGKDAAHLMVHAVIDFRDDLYKNRQMDGLRMLVDRGLPLDDHLQMAIYNYKPHLLEAVPDVYKVHHLSEAAEKGDAADVRLTLGLPVHPDAPARYKDNTPMCYGAWNGNLDLMDVLLEKGADIELKSPKTHRTPLQSAVRGGSVEGLGYLLEKGAKIDGSMELLELARDSGQKDVMRAVYDALIERGIMKTEVNAGHVAMKTIRLKTPGAS